MRIFHGVLFKQRNNSRLFGDKKNLLYFTQYINFIFFSRFCSAFRWAYTGEQLLWISVNIWTLPSCQNLTFNCLKISNFEWKFYNNFQWCDCDRQLPVIADYCQGFYNWHTICLNLVNFGVRRPDSLFYRTLSLVQREIKISNCPKLTVATIQLLWLILKIIKIIRAEFSA